MSARYDPPQRPMTATEKNERARLSGPLRAITAYLERVPAASTIEDAVALAAPVVLRQRNQRTVMGPKAIYPPWLRDWALREAARTGEWGPSVTLDALITALEFMGATATVTFTPRLHQRGVVRRDGWWRTSAEVTLRLHQSHYVPSLGRPLGRPVRTHSPRTPAPPRRGLYSVKVGDVISSVLREYLRTSRPTGLWTVATSECRPLVVAGRGRPRDGAPRAPRMTRALVRAESLASWTVDHAEQLELPRPLDTAEALAGLLRLTDEHPSACTIVGQASTPDRGVQRHLRDWFGVEVERMGVGAAPVVPVLAEIDAWFERFELARLPPSAQTAPLMSPADAAAFTGPPLGSPANPGWYPPIPDGKRPEDMTVDERDWFGVLFDHEK